MDRRAALHAAATLALPALLPSASSGKAASPSLGQSPKPAPAANSATPGPDQVIGYIFNARTKDVTLFDPVTREVLATKPLGAVVRWLSNEQHYWDGRHIWTYDFPDDAVEALAIDPRAVSVARRLPTGGTGPAHSLMLTPDRKSAWLNVAGDDALVVLDLATGEVAAEVKTGTFP